MIQFSGVLPQSCPSKGFQSPNPKQEKSTKSGLSSSGGAWNAALAGEQVGGAAWPRGANCGQLCGGMVLRL